MVYFNSFQVYLNTKELHGNQSTLRGITEFTHVFLTLTTLAWLSWWLCNNEKSFYKECLNTTHMAQFTFTVIADDFCMLLHGIIHLC